MSINYIYAKNGVGKSKLKGEQLKKGNVALNSNGYDWTEERLQEPAKSITLALFANEIKNLEKKLKEIKEKMEGKSDSIDWQGKITNLKPHVKKILDNEFYNVNFWENEHKNEKNDIQIDSLVRYFDEYQTYKNFLSSLSDSEFKKMLSVVKVSQNIKKNEHIEGEDEINQLHNNLIDYINNYIKKYQSPENRKLITELINETPNILITIKEKESDKTKEMIDKHIHWKLSTFSEKKSLIEDLRSLEEKKEKSKTFFTNVVAPTFDEKISLKDGAAVIKHDFGLSSGQITLILAKLIVENADDNLKEIWFDDVFETLDNENQIKLMKFLANSSKKINVLSHMTNVLEIKDILIAENEIKSNSINTRALTKNGSLISSTKSWAEILTKLRGFDKGDKEIKRKVRSIVKMLTRYHAQISSIHSFKGTKTIGEIEKSETFSHFSAWWFFHYCPTILENEYKTFFDWMEKSMNGNKTSIEIFDFLINELHEVADDDKTWLKDEIKIDVEKLADFLKTIKKELSIEKALYDKEEEKNKILNGSNQGKIYKKLREKYKCEPRNNEYIHEIDISPDPITP